MSESTSDPEDTSPVADDPNSVRNDPTPGPTNSTPVPSDKTPDPNDPIPGSNYPTLDPKDPTSGPTDLPPIPSDPTSDPNDPTPDPNDPTPAPNDPTPIPNDPTPIPNDPTPIPNDPTPIPNDPTPIPNDPIPIPNDPTPGPTSSDEFRNKPEVSDPSSFDWPKTSENDSTPGPSSSDEFRNKPEVSDPSSFDWPKTSEDVALPKVEAHNRSEHSDSKSDTDTEELGASCTGLPASTTTLENLTIATSTNEQVSVEDIPKSQFVEQVGDPQQICKIFVDTSVAQNEASSYAEEDLRSISLNHRQQNNHQTQDEMLQSEKTSYCVEMYYRLRSIFPNVDPEYLKNICPSEWGVGDRNVQLTSLIEDLLEQGALVEHGLDYRPATTGEWEFKNDTAETRDDIKYMHETLLDIFPDADPHYLRENAEKVVGKPDSLEAFVEEKLRSHDYPTREQYTTNLKIMEQKRLYTTDFDVKQFLRIIPDPFTHFMDPKRKCLYNGAALDFLVNYFPSIKRTHISSTYEQTRYNISATFELFNVHRLTPGECIMDTEDIELLQEFAFVKHYSEIKAHMLKEKTLQDTEFRILKQQNGLIECQCCFDSECIPSKCSDCENGHRFCNSCVEKGTSAKMADGETRITCFVDCDSEFSLSTLQRVLAPTTFSVLLKKRQAAEIIQASLEGLVFCPFCDFASIPPEEDKVFKCLNPECMKESCRLCKELSHVPLRCDEVRKTDNTDETDKARLYIEEKMTQALARKCYYCHRAFVKEGGCNKITCPCGARMCYLCDQPLGRDAYKHFRGQGSFEMKLCPLYSDTMRLDAVAVRKVAEQAQAEIMKINPNVEIDTTKLLPMIPRPTTGAHTSVINADELPRRVQQVVYEPL